MDTKGRLEVCSDGYWGSVCREYDNTIATVVCRQLGYFAAGQWIHIKDHTCFLVTIITFIYPGWMFSVYESEVPHLPTIVDGLSCTGNETSLLDCCHSRGRHNCYRTTGIECTGSYLHINQ